MSERETEAVSDVQVVKMTAEMVEEVYRLGMQTPQFDVGTETPQMHSQEALLRAIDDDNHILLAAMDGEILVGFCVTAIDTALRDAEIHELVVKEEYQSRGVGSKLLEETLRKLEERPADVNHVTGWIQKANTKVQSFMAKHDFSVGGDFVPVDMMLPRKK